DLNDRCRRFHHNGQIVRADTGSGSNAFTVHRDSASLSSAVIPSILALRDGSVLSCSLKATAFACRNATASLCLSSSSGTSFVGWKKFLSFAKVSIDPEPSPKFWYVPRASDSNRTGVSRFPNSPVLSSLAPQGVFPWPCPMRLGRDYDLS